MTKTIYGKRLSKLVFICIAQVLISAAAFADAVKVACVGDSITFGAGIRDRGELSYPAQLQTMLGEGYEVRNFGNSGSALLGASDKPYVKQKEYAEALAFAPDIVLIKLGTNDSKPDNWEHSADFKRDLNALIDSFQKTDSKPKIYLCRPTFAAMDAWGINEYTITTQVFPIIKSVAEERGIGIIDMHEPLFGQPELFSDGIHPNAAGAYKMAAAACKALTGKDAKRRPNPVIFQTDQWGEYALHRFTFAGREVKIAAPHLPEAGNLWIWRPAFFGAFPSVDLEMLKRGYYIVYLDLTHDYGCPDAVELASGFYRQMTIVRGLNPKVVLEGFSRGGLMAMNWAKANPDKVSCIYLDAPVCDVKSWPGETSRLWKDLLLKWRIENADNFKGNAFDGIENLAKAKVPIIIVSGDSDNTVPYSTNGAVLAKKYQSMGAPMKVIIKPGGDHHPHSLEDPKEIADFISAHSPKN